MSRSELPFELPRPFVPEKPLYSQHNFVIVEDRAFYHGLKDILERHLTEVDFACEHMTSGSGLDSVIVMRSVLTRLKEILGMKPTVKTDNGFVFPVTGDDLLMFDMKNNILSRIETGYVISAEEPLHMSLQQLMDFKKKTGGYVNGVHCYLCGKRCTLWVDNLKGGITTVTNGRKVSNAMYDRLDEMVKEEFRGNAITGLICPLYLRTIASRGGLGYGVSLAVKHAFASLLRRVLKDHVIKEITSHDGKFTIPVYDVLGRAFVILPRAEEPHVFYGLLSTELEGIVGREVDILVAPYIGDAVLYHPRKHVIEKALENMKKGRFIITRINSKKPRPSYFCEQCPIKCSAYWQAQARYEHPLKPRAYPVTSIKLKGPALRAVEDVYLRPATRKEVRDVLKEIIYKRAPVYEELFLVKILPENIKFYPETKKDAIRLRMIIDTGSPETIIDKTVFEILRIPPVGYGLLSGIGGSVETPFYVVRMRVKDLKPATLVVAGGGRIDNYDGLVGMDYIKKSGASITIKP